MPSNEKKNRSLTRSRRPPRRGVERETDDVYSRPANLYFLPRTGGWSGKIQFFSARDQLEDLAERRLSSFKQFPLFASVFPRFPLVEQVSRLWKYFCSGGSKRNALWHLSQVSA